MELTPLVLAAGLVATFVMGLSKTSMPPVGAFGVALLATVLPPLPSTGVALPVLLVGDVIALSLYGRHADRHLLVRLLPSVAVGLVAGYVLVRWVDAGVVTRVIGAVLLATVLAEAVRRIGVRRAASAAADRPGGPVVAGATARSQPAGPVPAAPPTTSAAAVPTTAAAVPPRDPAGPGQGGVVPAVGRATDPAAVLLGAGAGLSTMVANAGGPMMTLYLLRMQVKTFAFLGTVAWFFFSVNLLKLPFSIGLGLITPQSLLISAAIAPGIVLGGLTGRRLVARMSRRVFETVALSATAVASLWLLLH